MDTPRKQKLPLEVTILFHDPKVNNIFAELLEAGGVNTRIPCGIPAALKNTKIITEPDYLPEIPKELYGSCLVVGPEQALEGLEMLTLSQPLTEQKVERAIEKLLSK